MTRDDELAALWSTASATDDLEFARLARRTPRLARVALWGELAMVALLGGTVALAIVWNLGATTLLVGSLILLLLAWSAWKRHHLGIVALLIDERDRVSFIRSSVRAKEAELNRSALGLALILPGTLLTMLLGFSLRDEDGGELAAFIAAIVTTPRGLIALGFLLCALMILSVSHIRLAGELARLRVLQEDYVREEQLDLLLGD